jgi:hypothetical protein
MKRKRTIVSIVTLLAGLAVGMPTAALAGGPLLGGYGGPGAGAQAILGAALLNGPAGSSGGGGGAAGASLANPATSTGVGSSASHAATGAKERAGGLRRGEHSKRAAGAARGTYPRAGGANPHLSHLGGSAAVTTSVVGTSWFSGADLLALLLASGVLALVAVATVRLTRTEHH